MAKSRQTFASGAAILGVTGLLCSALGSVYRIVLAHVIGDVGIAYYQIAYPIYSFLSVVATVGIPAAISKQISTLMAKDDYKNARAFFLTSLQTLCVGGLVASALLALFNGIIAGMQGVPDAGLMVQSVAPALFFSCIISAFRGYFQGMQRMEPTAYSLLIEEVVKSVFGFALMLLWLSSGSRLSAMGALLGIPIAEAAATLYLGIHYLRQRDGFLRQVRQTPQGYGIVPARDRLRTLFKLSVPITLSAAVLPLITLLDNLMVINVLKSNGFSQVMAQTRFGLLTGIVAPVVYVPMALANALQMSLVPSVSASATLRRYHEVEQQSRVGIKLAILLGLPFSVGLCILGPPLLQALFFKTMTDQNTLMAASALVRTLGVALFFLMLAQTSNGILQGMGEMPSPLKHLWQGAFIKLIASYLLMSMPSVHINGAAIGTLLCFAYIAMSNLYSIRKILRRPLDLGKKLIAVIVSGLVMGILVGASYLLLHLFLPFWICVIVGILLGAASYSFLILRLRAIGPEDCRLLPGGLALDSLMHRIGWWK